MKDANGKIYSEDFVNLKAKVKALMLTRNQKNSVASYGSATYDYTNIPTNNNPIYGEHLEKILIPMNQINSDSIDAIYPGNLTKTNMENLELQVDAWTSRELTDRSASDCKSGCAGTCTTSCSTGCYTGCYTGCFSCGGSCSNNCSTTCTGDCSATCTGGCNTSCTGSCTGGCGSGCSSNCSSCAKSCSMGCTLENCGSTCLCENGCSNTCYSIASFTS